MHARWPSMRLSSGSACEGHVFELRAYNPTVTSGSDTTYSFTQIQQSFFLPPPRPFLFHVAQASLLYPALPAEVTGMHQVSVSQNFQSVCRSQSSTDHRVPLIPEKRGKLKRFHLLSAK